MKQHACMKGEWQINERLRGELDRALLVGLEIKASRSLFSAEDSLDELALLAETAGIEVRHRVAQRLSRVDPATFIGSGKVQEIVELLFRQDEVVVVVHHHGGRLVALCQALHLHHREHPVLRGFAG